MTDMEKILTLYEAMAERLEKSRFGAREARVYREMIEFMRGCRTAEEATEKIRTSSYYLAPSAAAVCDNIDALRAAASETGMDDAAAVYDEKLREIAEDETAMYDPGYHERAKAEKDRYLSTMESFTLIFHDWASLRMAKKNDHLAVDSLARSIRSHLGALQKPSGDFRELSELPNFRALIPLTDAYYRVFVSDVIAFHQTGALPGCEQAAPKYDPEEEWKRVEEALSEIDEAGDRYLAMTKDACVTVTAPDTADGTYAYSEERIR